ncbi:hypothetical protein B0H14DRAFT_1612872 [Mycena olivaceomarginata]|nr:hypothetical protein B0H14DRAFT_1612872 [Mycena olivaceomarginata]
MQCVYLLSTFFSSGCLATHCASYYNRSKGSFHVSATSPPQVPQSFHIIVFLDPPPFSIAHQRCQSISPSPQIWASQELSNAFHFLMGCFKFDASVKTHEDNKDHAPDTATKTFRLTQAIVKGTQCMVYVTLCARVGLVVIFQQIFALVNGQDFWDKLDKRLAKIRREADGDAKKIIKCVPHSELFFSILIHNSSQRSAIFWTGTRKSMSKPMTPSTRQPSMNSSRGSTTSSTLRPSTR